ncbi:c-type cytochrome [Gorillibacterium sp. sgz5001074]|uniref:c-type cytochrome n=1 Tax=Gorillibacterium sp. sgz5001074 TaxID=3446695 RepID=UPI003F6662AD
MRKMGQALLLAGAGAMILALAACGGNKNAASPSPTAASPKATAGAGAASPGAASPGAASPGAAAPGTAASPAAGGATTANVEALYKANCVACHGDKMDGNGAANRNIAKVGAKYTKEQILGIITNGRNGMPAFKGKLKDEELNALADWLAAKK